MKRMFLIGGLLFAGVSLIFAGGGGESEATAQADMDTQVDVSEGYTSVTESGVNIQWMVDGEMLRVIMSAQKTGWVSVGFDPSRQMKDANIIIGYVSNGEVSLRDDYGTGAVRHGADVDNDGTDDLSEVEGSEEDGVTTISFAIPLDSGDSMDKPLSVGGSYRMIVAHGPDGKDDFGSYHAGRGGVDITIE